jgi:hypothetical protein
MLDVVLGVLGLGVVADAVRRLLGWRQRRREFLIDLVQLRNSAQVLHARLGEILDMSKRWADALDRDNTSGEEAIEVERNLYRTPERALAETAYFVASYMAQSALVNSRWRFRYYRREYRRSFPMALEAVNRALCRVDPEGAYLEGSGEDRQINWADRVSIERLMLVDNESKDGLPARQVMTEAEFRRAYHDDGPIPEAMESVRTFLTGDLSPRSKLRQRLTHVRSCLETLLADARPMAESPPSVFAVREWPAPWRRLRRAAPPAALPERD